MSRLSFQLEAVAPGSSARAGRFRTLHNEVLTPLFMPVGTRATVRNQRFEDLKESGSQILLANTYHLLLRPGPELFLKLGGIHKLMNWERSVLTDSGGFQIFSLSEQRKMTEEGAAFTSQIEARKILLTPELSIEMQKAIGSDIMMVLDQCVPSTSPRELAEQAMHLTHRWAKRSLEARGDSPQSLFGIIQGACYADLRKQSAEVLSQMSFDGFAIGGLAVGEAKSEREDFTEMTAQMMPAHLPRYLMGVGTPIDLLEAVHRGVDMFDCILPVSLAQQGVTYTSMGRVDLRRGVYTFSDEKLDPNCACSTCQKYSRAYLRHLIKCNEPLGWQLVASHNVHFYHSLMNEIRLSILQGRFLELYHQKRQNLVLKDEDNPVKAPKIKKVSRPISRLGNFECIESELGHASIKHTPSGEIMHSVSPPAEESKKIYIDQSRLAQRILQEGNPNELVVWDVGLGAGSNLMAAVKCVEATHQQFAGGMLRSVRIVSFEKDLDALRLAIENSDEFPDLKHSAPYSLLRRGGWKSKDGKISIDLVEGDFLVNFEKMPVPEIIFYDPFSNQTDSELWTTSTFKKIRNHLGERGLSELFTYSASTEIRTRLLEAGFYVLHGAATGPKSETTIAITTGRKRFWSQKQFLGSAWLKRWERGPFKQEGWDVLQHRQFETDFLESND